MATYEYFAQKEPKDIGEAVFARLESIATACGKGMHARYRGAYAHYYGTEMGFGDTSAVTRGGSQGELARVRVNKARANAKSLLGLVLGPKFTWRPQARNGDARARGSVLISTNLLEFYWKRRQLVRQVTKWLETAICFAEGFLLPHWDTTLGAATATTETGQAVHQGDMGFRVVQPWNVLRDPERECWEDEDWVAMRSFMSRATLLAQYPTDVLGQPTATMAGLEGPLQQRFKLELPTGAVNLQDSDTVVVWRLWHKKTPAVPAGLEVLLVNPQCVLELGPLTTEGLPLLRLPADEMLGTPYGYTSWWDGNGIQDVMDGLQTAIATNQLTLATQSIAMEEGSKTPAEQAYGMNLFYYPPGRQPPTPLQLTKSPPEVFEHLQTLAADQRDILGLNDVVQGNPDTAQMNAEAFTLLASMAVQRNSPLQQTVVSAVGELGSVTLAMLRANLDGARKVAIAGSDASLYEEREYTADDLALIDSVIVEVGNPLEQTAAGRYQLAQMLLQVPGAISSPEQLQQVVETGRIEPATQGPRAALLALQAENEALLRGEVPMTHPLEDHLLHFRENAAVIHRPGAKENPAILAAVKQHCDEHYRTYWGLAAPVDPVTGAAGAAPDPMSDPQYPVRVRMMLGQQPPPMMAPTRPGEPPPEGEGGAPAGPPPPDAPAAPEDASSPLAPPIAA